MGLTPWRVSGLPPAAATVAVAAALLILLAAVLALTIARAEANGASTIIMDHTQGPYRVVVGIIPARPVIPQTHLAIQVFDSDDRLLRDTDVQLLISPPARRVRRSSARSRWGTTNRCAISRWMYPLMWWGPGAFP